MAKKKEILLDHYGSATVGERGQIALPIEARKKFKIESGEKLMVLGSTACGFDQIILMKSEAVVGMLNHLFEAEKLLRDGSPESLKKLTGKNKPEIKQFLEEGGTKALEKKLRGKK